MPTAAHHIPQLPVPMSTIDFPDKRRGRRARKRLRTAALLASDCAVCLEDLPSSALPLPCGHRFHRACIFAVLTSPVLGACSMMRCPMCRAAVDRHDLGAMGFDVSPRRLALAHSRCVSLRCLAVGIGPFAGHLPVLRTISLLVRQCADTEAVDGFLYNAAVLAIERSLFHRINLAKSIEVQLQAPRNRRFEPVEFIRTSVACHVEVLMHTATAAP